MLLSYQEATVTAGRRLNKFNFLPVVAVVSQYRRQIIITNVNALPATASGIRRWQKAEGRRQKAEGRKQSQAPYGSMETRLNWARTQSTLMKFDFNLSACC